MKLIVGLGNPGPDYAETRHNAGFRVVDELARRVSARWQTRGVPEMHYAEWPGGGSVLVKPQTMMNLSGHAAELAARTWHAAPHETLIVFDEAAVPLGTLRLRPLGGSGGHHGLASCLEAFGTEDVPRLRVGIGIDPLPHNLAAFVLAPFHADERPVVDSMIAQAVEACELWATRGIEAAMNKVNGRTP